MSIQQVEVSIHRYPEISLEEEWKRQVDVMTKIFAPSLNISPTAYIESLPKFPSKPENYDDLHLVKPLLVETRIPWHIQAELSGIDISGYLTSRIDEVSEVKDIVIPKKPYGIWIQDETIYSEKKPVVIQNFQPDERGGTMFEGIAQWNAYPGAVIRKCIDLVGSRVGEDGIPYMYFWYGNPLLDYHTPDYAPPHLHPIISGREISIK